MRVICIRVAKYYNKLITHIFDISLYCVIKIVGNIFIRVVFPALYCLGTTGNEIFELHELFS